jgi:hypothetical protein
MEKSPPRSYKKQQKKKRILNELPKSSKNTKKNQTSLLSKTVDRKICKNLKIEKQHQLGFGEPN